jgi:hypothetical protein
MNGKMLISKEIKDVSFPSQLDYSNTENNYYSSILNKKLYPYNNNQYFRPNQKIIFKIPTYYNSFIDKSELYMKFNVNITGETTVANRGIACDLGGAGFIYNFKVYDDYTGEMLEEINDYPAIYSLYNDFIRNSINIITNGHSLSGESGSFPNVGISASCPSPVMQINFKRDTAGFINGNAVLCVPFYMSSIFGLWNNKLLPINYTNGLRIEIMLSQSQYNLSGFISSSMDNFFLTNDSDILDYNYILSDVELNVSYVEVLKEYLYKLPQHIFIHSTFIRNYKYINRIGVNNTQITLQIPGGLSKIKSILLFFRQTNQINNNRSFIISSRYRFNAQNFQCKIGNNYVFEKPLNSSFSFNTSGTAIYNYSEFFAELKKSLIHSFDFYSGSSVNGSNYALNNYDDIATFTDVGKFAIGFDLSPFFIENSGYSVSNQQDIIITGNLSYSSPVDVLCDIYIIYHKNIYFNNDIKKISTV